VVVMDLCVNIAVTLFRMLKAISSLL